MALSAGLIVPSSQPELSWDVEQLIWKNYLIKVNYIGNENSIDNPVLKDDIIIDQNPSIFRIMTVHEALEDDVFKVDIYSIDKPRDPQFALQSSTQRGLVCTPNELGFINPNSNGTVVENSPFRLAMVYNFKYNQIIKNRLDNSGTSQDPIEIPFIPNKFVHLDDTPSNYGAGGQFVRLTEEGTTLEFVDPPSNGDAISKKLITISSNSYGTVIPNGSFEVPIGANLDVLINPFQGYIISEILQDSQSITPTQRITFENVTDNHTLNISFSSPEMEGPTGGGISDIKFPVLDVSTINNFNRKIAIGLTHFIVLGTDNKVYCTGSNTAGEFGNNTTISQRENWYKYDPPVIFNQIYADYRTSGAIDNLGHLWVWGENWENKIGTEEDVILSPRKISDELIFKNFSIGGICCLALTQDGHIYGCGEMGVDVGHYTEFTRIGDPEKIYKWVCAGMYTCAVIDDKGKLFTFGQLRGNYWDKDILFVKSSSQQPDSFGFYRADSVHNYDMIFSDMPTQSQYDNTIKPGGTFESNKFYAIDVYKNLHRLGTNQGEYVYDNVSLDYLSPLNSLDEFGFQVHYEDGGVSTWTQNAGANGTGFKPYMLGGKGIFSEAGGDSLFITDKGDIFIYGARWHSIKPYDWTWKIINN